MEVIILHNIISVTNQQIYTSIVGLQWESETHYTKHLHEKNITFYSMD